MGKLIAPPPPSKPTPGSFLKHSPLACLLLLPGLYFPVSSHHWYALMHRLIPSSDLLPVLGKSVLGQIFYGPIYTSMFFLSQLIPVSEKEGFLASFADAFRNLLLPKIRRDFFGVWEVGVWFWITVDLISFKFIPLNLIPLYERPRAPGAKAEGRPHLVRARPSRSI